MSTSKRVNLDLTKIDGNAFALMAAFRAQARRDGWSSDEINSVLLKCMSGDYDNLVCTLSECCYAGSSTHNGSNA